MSQSSDKQETPRTDAEETRIAVRPDGLCVQEFWDMAAFCRQLERELAEAKQLVESYRALCDQVSDPSATLPIPHDWQPDGGKVTWESHPGGEAPHVHTTCSKCGARAWFLEFHWELLSKGCDAKSSYVNSLSPTEKP